MEPRARNAFLIGAALVAATTLARAQPIDPIGDLLAAGASQPASVDTSRRQTVARPLSANDQALFTQGLNAARRGDVAGARSAIGSLSDSVARKAVLWAVVDTSAEEMSFWEVDAARRDLAGFPRPGRRQAAAEKLIETSGKSPGEVVAWFAGQEPTTPQGAIALASAYRSLGQTQPAAELIRRWWRDKSFEVDAQRAMLTRFGDVLTVDDHARRTDILLYGGQGPAAREMMALIPADQQPAALARIALRADAGNATSLYEALTPEQQASPGVAFERAAYLRRKGMDTLAMAQLASFPHEVATTEQADRLWDERYRLVLSSLRAGDHRTAYQAAAASGLNQGQDATEA